MLVTNATESDVTVCHDSGQNDREKPMRNPFRSLDPTAVEKSENINRRASELQRIATTGVSSDGKALTALGNALVSEIGAMVSARVA
jgi:hypothetical protein